MKYIRPRTTGVRLFALLAAAALLSTVGVFGAARADAAPSAPTEFVVEKVDAVTDTPLAGAHFTFYDHVGTEIGTCVTDARGLCQIDGTTNFSYKVQEDTPPTGYLAQPGVLSAPVITSPLANPPLIFRDQRTGTSLQKVFLKKVDGSTNAPLQNAVFRLNGFVGESATCITDAQGMCEVDDVPAGSYAWQELQAPSGYDAVTNTSPVTVAVGVPPAVTTVADQKTGTSTLTVQKVDADTNLALAGVHFSLNGTNASCITDAVGSCSVSGLSPGTYSWHETSAPAGYQTAADSSDIVITATNAGNAFAPTLVTDAEIRTDLTVQKVDAANQGHTLAGATFHLTVAGNPANVVGSCTTTAQQNGSCTVQGLPFGTYTWVEVTAPSGYDLPANPSSPPIDVNAGNAGTTLPATVRSDTATQSTPSSTLTVQKVDADTNLALAGVHFSLNGANATCITDVSGMCSISGLSPGTYSWHETSAPAGYQTAADSSDIVITAANAGNAFAPTLVTDAEVRTDLTVQKVDAANQGHTLAGATFHLTVAGNPAHVVGSCTTTAQQNGSCTVPNLPFGTYTWLEVAAPSGYDLPAHLTSLPIDVTAGNAGTTIAASVLSDTASRSTLTLKKVDAADHTSPVAGATYQLFRESNGVSGLQATAVPPRAGDSKSGQCTTVVDGTCSIAGLPDETYYWLEVSAPPGYALSAQPSHAVVVGSSSVQETTVADAKLVTTPVSSRTNQTGGGLAFTGANVFALARAATVLLAAGSLLLLLTNRRRRTPRGARQ